jgi:hypothetical protein
MLPELVSAVWPELNPVWTFSFPDWTTREGFRVDTPTCRRSGGRGCWSTPWPGEDLACLGLAASSKLVLRLPPSHLFWPSS